MTMAAETPGQRPSGPDGPVILTLSPAELSTRTLSTHTIQRALHALHSDGLVALANAVSPAHLSALNERMQRDAAQLLGQPAGVHRNFGAATGNIQQEPPTTPSLVYADVIANSFATQLTECVLGPRPVLRFYSANTAARAEGRQPVHVDLEFGGYPTQFAFGYCVNVCLDEVGLQNGATEVWLGSHLVAMAEGRDCVDVIDGRMASVEERRRVRPPVRTCLPKGALVIRDFRLWHAGMPNLTDVPRVMLVTIHFARWWRSKLKIKLEEGSRGKIEWGGLEPAVEWVGDGHEYLKGAHDFTFAQDVD
ncbi:phytanoyl-dioxygenase family protein [Diplodia corticola]|uniref:Phytanoyl-dioxygenase family protein n=1 Tax=Diplodia corticola TaxID=236234 RepID=A0A1J9QS90_9PEZI|nr:phytanoyl-dioxygenase family protein [Diplodia corticola]OJD30850.1 phytanoyl-dioxygenase family protein [Diplodia corticola]